MVSQTQQNSSSSVLFILTCGVCISLLLPTDASADNLNSTLVTLGTVNGKTFFMDNSIRRTWIEARSYGYSLNLDLAEFMTAEESDFIVNLSTSMLPLNTYWTGGRDAQRESQFIWEPSYKNFTSHSLGFVATSPRTCIYLSQLMSGKRVLMAHGCEGQAYAILQSRN